MPVSPIADPPRLLMTAFGRSRKLAAMRARAVVYHHPIISRERLAELVLAVAAKRGVYRLRPSGRVIEPTSPPEK